MNSLSTLLLLLAQTGTPATLDLPRYKAQEVPATAFSSRPGIFGAQGEGSLNHLFTLEPNVLKNAYAVGRKVCKDKGKIDNFLQPFKKDVGKVRSPSGQHWEAPYALFDPPFASVEYLGYEDQRQYNDDANLKKRLDEWSNLTPDKQSMKFIARLYAWPGVNDYNGAVNRLANQEDVKNVHFVLIVDGDVEHALHPLIDPSLEKESANSGSYNIPEVTTVSGVYSTYSIYSESSRSFNWYHADYVLFFPLFDESRKPYVTERTKTLELKVVYPSGEHSAKYFLEDYKLPQGASISNAASGIVGGIAQQSNP